MKKVLAAFAAAAMLCCTFTSPVSAAETYLPGDVNLDGVVDLYDSQLMVLDYGELLVFHKGILTPEQRQIGNLDGKSCEVGAVLTEIDLVDAMFALQYYAAHLINPDITMEDVLGFEPKVDDAIKEFLATHKLVWDVETEEYVYVER